jgi:hypothetical protein
MKTWDTDDSLKMIGHVIQSIVIKEDNVIITTDRQIFTLGCEGDCCAQAYFSDLEVCSLPAKVLGWGDDSHGEIEDPHGEAHDTQFVKITTDKGYIDFTLHTEHNGYYGGWYFLSHVKDLPLLTEPMRRDPQWI